MLKKIARISGIVLAALAGLILLLWVLIRIPSIQNGLVQYASKKISQSLNTEVKVDQVDFSPFNRFYVNGLLIRDQSKDTLLYAGSLKVRITDWFFFKDQITLHYIGLENAFVRTSRTDSIWNYAFLNSSSSVPDTSTPAPTNIRLEIKEVSLEHIRFHTLDKWRGEDQLISIEDLFLSAKEIDPKKKRIVINALDITSPRFALRQYKGNRPDSLIPITPPRIPAELYWNPEQWLMQAKAITITNGLFSSDLDTDREPYPYFDGAHISFTQINGKLEDLWLRDDTISTSLKLSTKERSGFSVNSLSARMRVDPTIMEFDQLDIRTPFSQLRHYFAMKYDSFTDDMGEFVSEVSLDGDIDNSVVDFKDLAFFAPELKELDLKIDLDGKVKGPVNNLEADGIRLEFGKNSYIGGDLHIVGLPDVDRTDYALNNTRISVTPSDLYTAIPYLKKQLPFSLDPMERMQYAGAVQIKGTSLSTKGLLESALGSISTDLTIEHIAAKNMKTIVKGKLNSFDAGSLFNVTSLGKLDGTLAVSSEPNNSWKFSTNLNTLELNSYNFQSIEVNGAYRDDRVFATLNLNDQNLQGVLLANVDLTDSIPFTTAEVEIFSSNLKAIGLTDLPIEFSGKAEVDLKGNEPDNLNGEARFSELVFKRDGQTYDFDEIVFKAKTNDRLRSFSVNGKDIEAMAEGEFRFDALTSTINRYFASYYPMYFESSSATPEDVSIRFNLQLKNAGPLLKVLNNGLGGLSYSSIEGNLDTRNQLLDFRATIPKLTFGTFAAYDFVFQANGNPDSLKMYSKTSSIQFNDSLSFPKNEIDIRSSRDLSILNINTFSEQSDYGAQLSASIQNLKDGIRINFNPSALVFNEKTWNIERNGEVVISTSRFEANNFRLTNGEQSFSLITLPYEANSPQTMILTLNKVNLGELLPFVISEPQIQGITSGDLTIEDPFGNLKLYLNAQTEKTQVEKDSIGITSITGFWDNTEKRSSFYFQSDNPNYQVDVRGRLNLKDSLNERIDMDIDIANVRLSVLEPYLGIVFSKMDGIGKGKLQITGNLNEPDLLGAVSIKDAAVTVGYTQCSYTLQDPVIRFTPDKIDLGTIQLRDKFGNLAQLRGSLDHRFFNDFRYNISASSRKMLVLDTDRDDNDLFYGNTVANFNFSITGPEEQMLMRVTGAPVDSSVINILTTTTSKQGENVDYIVWKTYGNEVEQRKIELSSNLIIELDLTATPLLRMNIILDELTGDVLAGQGNGNLKIRTGTKEPLTMNGRFNITSGNYNFNFQDIFKKPFRLVGDGSSYISWNGDPFDAEINIDALYLAEKVRMSTLFTDPTNSTVSGVSSDVLREISDIEVRCNLSGTLSKPNPTFQIVIPQNSIVRNNATIDSKLKTINRDPLEVSKQATYLIVFKSFAPQAAVVASDLNAQLINSTISGVINGILSNSVQNLFSRVLGSSVDVNFNYSRTMTNITGTTNSSDGSTNFRENVSLQFIKSIMNDKLIITFGSDFNFASATGNQTATGAQSFLFLPDVNVEYKITPDGKFRTSFFYRSSFDMLSTSGKRDRTGGNISFRTEFDRLFARKPKVTSKED